jgi:hypothetical protein
MQPRTGEGSHGSSVCVRGSQEQAKAAMEARSVQQARRRPPWKLASLLRCLRSGREERLSTTSEKFTQEKFLFFPVKDAVKSPAVDLDLGLDPLLCLTLARTPLQLI